MEEVLRIVLCKEEGLSFILCIQSLMNIIYILLLLKKSFNLLFSQLWATFNMMFLLCLVILLSHGERIQNAKESYIVDISMFTGTFSWLMNLHLFMNWLVAYENHMQQLKII